MKNKLYWGIATLIIILIVFTTIIHLNTKSDNQQYKKDIAAANQKLKNRTNEQNKQSINDRQSQTELTDTPADSTEPHAEKPKTDTIRDKLNHPTNINNDVIADTSTSESVRMSPHGFGAYPIVPEGAPIGTFDETDSVNQELLGRVLVKLWNDGEKHIGGFIVGDTGKVYPYYENTLYIEYGEKINFLNRKKYIGVTSVTCSPSIDKSIVDAVLDDDKPAGYTLIDIDESGIDPYEYLELQ